ncbi:hypothetical protein WI229_23900 (plasmid) [Salmonella enterica subsp. enterica serovar Infantis]
MAMADYVKQQREECLQKDKKVRRQTRVTRRQMTPDEIDPKSWRRVVILSDAAANSSGYMFPPCVQASGGIYSAHLK